jgi:hypothetical protein
MPVVVLLASACGFEHGALGPNGGDDANGGGDDSGGGGGGGTSDAGFDAPTFSVTRCPAGYSAVSGANAASRYRLITTTHNFWDSHDACNSDSAPPEITHLVTLGSQGEADALAAIAGARFYIGATQDPNQTVKSANWHMFDGNPPASAWAVNDSPSEPSDADGTENGQEQVAIADTNALMSDAGGLTLYRAICECDGVPIASNVIIPPHP